ncbi:DUF928 domain-containing protein [Moorena producens]|uniref:DUF928 domain-containing protein n=1 Tax=Moorena producens TaxID=1155739 RepID=UPI003C75A2F2
MKQKKRTIIVAVAIIICIFVIANKTLSHSLFFDKYQNQARLNLDKNLSIQPPHQDENNTIIFKQRLEAKDDAPVRRRHAGSSGGNNQCQSGESKRIPLTALVPDGEYKVLTAQGFPTFWFYVPYFSNSQLKAQFSLRNLDDKLDLQEEEYYLVGTPGIIEVSVLKSLEIGKNYRWFFEIICNPEDPSANSYVNGKVMRVNLTPELRSLPEAPIERAKLYARNGLWSETLTTLLEDFDSQEVRLQLTQLLQSEGLGDISQKPLVPCCIPEKQQSSSSNPNSY